ncbi:C4-dicarboxylate ABC transporter substrate-binding protein [Methylocella tundrae]|uniref:C4-dicarboxylate ABC transporter substrate-binding protein n=1 Tax=Methylocella tundrae TaxID=227605 RepID=A0A8B6M4J2_METTU|nr:TAXI family TRAP transporter solute-binding subunit [Methylocella tundrae]VTZ26934.1 C4-dicarboxylate ABC transporter substrate-binding protein [Methylocella tundrae]VTZ49283.1 C4-dicarboxylate ABC transporter substrate-binding protein [Methylocella tundrae]
MRRLIIVAIGAAFAAIGAAALALYYYERPTVLHVAVTRESHDQRVLAAAAHEFAQKHESLRLKLVPVESLAESARIFEEDQVDLAIVRSDIDMPVSGQTVLIMRRNAAVVVAPAGSDLHDIEDLKGHKLGVLDAEQTGRMGNHTLLDAALAQYDVSLGTVRRIPLTLAELPEAIEQRQVDAVLAVDTPGSANLTEAVAAVAQAGRGPPVFLPIEDARAIAQRAPNFEPVEVLRGAFGGAQPKPSASFETLGVSTRLIAKPTLGNDVVSELTELMLNARPSLAAQDPIANRIEAPSTDKGAALPVHPGTLAYLGDEEQSFFDKYSDFIYIGAMLASLCGTAIATFAARFNRQQNTDLELILQRLLEIIAAARAAARADALDDLEREADDLLAKALAHDWNHALSGSRLAATSLALNQARQAISERRAYLAVPRAPFAPRLVGE